MGCDCILSHLSSAVTQIDVTRATSSPKALSIKPLATATVMGVGVQEECGALGRRCFGSTFQAGCYMEIWQDVVRFTADSQLDSTVQLEFSPRNYSYSARRAVHAFSKRLSVYIVKSLHSFRGMA